MNIVTDEFPLVILPGWSVFLAFLAGFLLAGFLLGLPAASLLHFFFFSWGGGASSSFFFLGTFIILTRM